jgi:hypothetical protein
MLGNSDHFPFAQRGMLAGFFYRGCPGKTGMVQTLGINAAIFFPN